MPELRRGVRIYEGDGTIQAEIDALRTKGGTLLIGGNEPYEYTTLDLEDARRIVIAGNGSAELICTAAGSGAGISLASAQRITFKDLHLRYSNPAFTGALVRTGHSSAASDPGYLNFKRVRLGGTVGVAAGAATLVDVDKAIIVGWRDCIFEQAIRAFKRLTSYCNTLLIDNCTFMGLSSVPIYNPGESWKIINSTFEPLADGKAGAVEFALADFMHGFKYSANWHGDVTVAGGNWVNIKALGAEFTGANIFSTALGTGYAIGLQGGCQGITISGGNRMTTAVGINILAASVLGLSVIGNDLQSATPFVGLGNANHPRIKGNNNFVTHGIGPDRGDANVTLVVGVDRPLQLAETPLTVNRTYTLSATNAYSGARFSVIRTGLGAGTLDFGGLKTIPAGTAARVDAMHNGTAWKLLGYQLL